MIKHRGWLMLAAFVLFILGFTALVMMLLGLNWVFLTFLDAFGRTFGMVMRLLMVVLGVLLFVVANTNWEKERREN
jgi:cytochrome c biogenesis protein CcdA